MCGCTETAAVASGSCWSCRLGLFPPSILGFFLCFSAFLMLEVLFKEETWTLLEQTFGTAPCHPSCSLGQVQGSTNESCCFPLDQPLFPASQ